MIIKEVIIENYLCYYGIKKFNISDGLNIILGENGEGKTKFYEAIEWLCNSDNNNLDILVSKKALEEREIGDSFRVRVEIVVEQYEETKILTRQYTVKKIDDDKCNVSNSNLTGIVESKNGERTPVDGNDLLEIIFPSEIRRYSMFKGEEELNIFDNSDALINLINLFSDAKHYEKYELKGEVLKVSAEKAVDAASKSNTKNKKEYDRIEADIKYYRRKLREQLTYKEETTSNIEKTSTNIQEVEKYIRNAEALEIINSRIKKIQSDISKNETRIRENYTTSLFDENWILMNFEDIHVEFSAKVAELSKSRRKAQSEFDKELGIKEGEKRAKNSLLKDLVPLPIGTPSKAIMDEMIKEKICKVCGTEAPEGSKALLYMQNRLKEYLSSQEESLKEDGEQPEKLFKYNYIQRLVNLSANHEDNLLRIRSIYSNIEELFAFNQSRKNDIFRLNEKLEKEIQERNKIIGNSAIGQEKLGVVLRDYNEWQRDLIKFNKNNLDFDIEINKLNSKLATLDEQKEKIDLTNANSFLLNTRNILRDIETILKDTKERKFDEFIGLLSEKSNDIFSKINVDAFTGIIDFSIRKIDRNRTKVKIQLQDQNGNIFPANQSLITSMHISVLLAISELNKEVREDRYPLVFDAPTSSFGESKMTEFLNLIYKTNNQTIILIKDYIAKDENKNLFIKPEFGKVKRDKAFWVKLERPFDEKNLKTINTLRIEL